MSNVLLVPDEGEVEMLKRIFGVSVAENLTLKLYTNNHAPAEGDTTAAYTECSATGYSAITLTAGGGWTCATGTGTSTATYAQQTFTLTATATIYGYYIVGATSAKVYVGQLFDAVANVPSGGGTVKITPVLQLE